MKKLNSVMVRRYEDMRSTERQTPAGIKCSKHLPLNFTSSTSFSLSMMSPFGLKVWQGQCTLISRPRLVPDGKQSWKRGPSIEFYLKKLTIPCKVSEIYMGGSLGLTAQVSPLFISHSLTVSVTSKETHSLVPLVNTFLAAM